MAFEFRLPDIGEGLTEAEIVRWVVELGGRVEEDEPLVEIETDKAVVEITSPRGGVVIYRGAEPGQSISVGAVLAVVGQPGESWNPADAAPIVGSLIEEAEILPSRPAPIPGPTGASRKALPLVRKLARELGVDLSKLHGTGPEGRITRDDVQEKARDQSGSSPAGRIEPGDDRVRLSRLRRTIAERMERSWREIPHVTTFETVPSDDLFDRRRALATLYGIPVPIEALVIKALLPVLAEFGEFNASLDGGDLILKRRYDIGVATDTPDGLIVPVVTRADARPLQDLAVEIARLAIAAQRRSLTPGELTGATFTVSNIGAVGGGYGTPIIPYGTTAILSIGRATPQAVVRDGTVTVAQMMPLSLSYDHRVIDGGLGRRFMSRLREHLENPDRFLTD